MESLAKEPVDSVYVNGILISFIIYMIVAIIILRKSDLITDRESLLNAIIGTPMACAIAAFFWFITAPLLAASGVIYFFIRNKIKEWQ